MSHPNAVDDPTESYPATSVEGGAGSELYYLCEAASADDPNSWDPVRRWLRARSNEPEALRRGAEAAGDAGASPLHLVCRSNPPVDVVKSLLAASRDVAQWKDEYGLLPLHHACAYGAAEDVLQQLVAAYREGVMEGDLRKRTPLHYLLSCVIRPATTNSAGLLVAAVTCADGFGRTPLHYACAYGASEDVIHVLTNKRSDLIIKTDSRGWTPLHLAMVNADRNPASPEIVSLLISQNRDVVNIPDDDGELPLHRLAGRAQGLSEERKVERSCTLKCFLYFIEAGPDPTAKFLTSLLALPDWLRDRAVVHPVVQQIINDRMARRFPTTILLLDFWSLLLILVTYSIMAKRATQGWLDGNEPDLKLQPLYVGVIWLTFHEIVQMISLKSLGHFDTWLRDPTNWIDVIFIATVVVGLCILEFFPVWKHPDDYESSVYAARTYFAVSLLILWVNIMSFLKSLLLDFAVFVNGVLFVVNQLKTFLVALFLIGWAFAHVFYLLFIETPYCDGAAVDDPKPFCDLVRSCLKVYTMLLGEVDYKILQNARPRWWAISLFAIFMFLVVILLANVLIAIVTDSYGVIRHERSAMVFWANRLDFVMEMDAIRTAARPLTKKARSLLGRKEDNPNIMTFQDGLSQIWRDLMELFEENVGERKRSLFSLDSMCRLIMRFAAIIFILVWVVVGFFTFGMLWPPEVRSILFELRLNPGSHKEAEESSKEITELWKEMEEHKENIESDVAVIKGDLAFMREQLANTKSDITNQMEEIKQIVNILFEFQT